MRSALQAESRGEKRAEDKAAGSPDHSDGAREETSKGAWGGRCVGGRKTRRVQQQGRREQRAPSGQKGQLCPVLMEVKEEQDGEGPAGVATWRS